MPASVRFPNGVTNVGARNPLANYPHPDPSRFIEFFDDFHTFTAANWTVTETQAGATQAVSTGASGGVLLLTNTTGNTDVNQVQLINETFRLSTNREFWLKARFSLTASTMANFGAVVGLAITDTTATAGVSDGIFFRKPSGGATLSAVLCKDSSETTISMGTITTATFVEAALYFDGRGTVDAWLDGAKVGSTTTLTNLCNDEDLAVTLATVNATAGAANVLSVDYFLAGLAR
jgi:hypothetical protein